MSTLLFVHDELTVCWMQCAELECRIGQDVRTFKFLSMRFLRCHRRDAQGVHEV